MAQTQSLNQEIYKKLLQIFQDLFLENDSEPKPTLSDFIYSILLFHLLGKKTPLPPDTLQAWIQKLRNTQQANGFFILTENETAAAQLESTALAITILKILDSDLKYPIYDARRFEKFDHIESWISQTNCLSPTENTTHQDAIWHGKSIVSMATILNKSFLDGLIDNPGLSYFIDCCDATANPDTGTWVPSGSEWRQPGIIDVFYRMQTYNFWNRQLPYPHKMLHSVFSVQNWNGHFGAAKENYLITDLAAISIMVTNYQQESFHQYRIRRSLKRVAGAMNKLIKKNSGWDLAPFLEIKWKFSLDDCHPSPVENQTQSLYFLALFYSILGMAKIEDVLFSTDSHVNNLTPCFCCLPQNE